MKVVMKVLSELSQFIEVEEGLLNILNGCTVKIYESDNDEAPDHSIANGLENGDILRQPFKKALQLSWLSEENCSAGHVFIIKDVQVEKFVSTMTYQDEQLKGR